MIKVIVLSTLLVASSLATLTINLDGQDIDETLYVVPSSSSSSSSGKASAAQSVPLKKVDQINLGTVKINDKNTQVLFDTTVGYNWNFQTEATPKVDGEYTVEVADGRSALLKATPFVVKDLDIDEQKLANVSVLKSNTLNTDANPQITKNVQYGFGLDKNYRTNFFNTLQNGDVSLEQQGFSFIVSEKINQITLGRPQKFFAQDDLETIYTETGNLWKVPVEKNSIVLKGLNQLSYSEPLYAVFDSTTRYIWAQDNLVNSIVDQLKNKGLNCNDVNTAAPVGIYDCDDGNFPPLTIAFKTRQSQDPASKASTSRTYVLNDYTDELPNNKVRLLIRKVSSYASSGKSVVPNLNSGNENELVLGTVWFENVYTYFDVASGNVQLSQAFQAAPQDQNVNSTARLWYLILGGILLLAALGALLALIREVPYKAASQPSSTVRTAPHQVVPQQSVVYAATTTPVYLQQSYVRPLNTTHQYVVSQQPLQLSPTRVYQTSYVPQ